jgi:hypothetical protein
MKYLTTSAKEWSRLIDFSIAVGVVNHWTGGSGATAERKFAWSRYPILQLKEGGLDGYAVPQSGTVTLQEFLLALVRFEKAKGVKLTETYTALVSFDSVKVGCQTFSHEVVRKLADAVRG